MNQQQSLFDVEETIRNSKSQKASEILTPSTRKILQLLTSQGINKTVTASLLDLAGASHEIVQYIVGPIVTQQNGWQQSIPSWVGKAIAVDRLDAALEEIDKGEVGKLASSSEVVALMMPIAFEVPLSSEWTDVYLWASYDALVRHRPFKNFNYENLWEKIGTTPIQYDKIRSDYETLATDIRSRVVKHAAFDLVAWGNQAEVIGNYVRKGTQIAITGEFGFDRWADKNSGTMRQKPVITINAIELLGSPRKEESTSTSAPNETQTVANANF